MALICRAGLPAGALTAPRRLADFRLRGWTRALRPVVAGNVGASQTRRFDVNDWQEVEHKEKNRLLILAQDKLSRQGPRHIYDVTSPTPSYLLNVTLDGLLPSEAQSPEYNINNTNHPLSPMSRMPLTMPQGHHLVYFPTPIQPALLEPDGTDPYHSPGGPFTRRVWASGSIDFSRDKLELDSSPAVCVETIEKVEAKGGGDETKILVHILRRYMPYDKTQKSRFNPNDTNCLTETRVLALMKAKRPEKPLDPFTAAFNPGLANAAEFKERQQKLRVIRVPWTATKFFDVTITPEMLFYFSALTLNAHAIHYDAARTKFIEGHQDILVHGPFCVVLMLSALRTVLATGHNSEAVKFFEYRNIVPVYANKPYKICIGSAVPERNPAYKSFHRMTVWIEDEQGSLCVRGTAHIGAKKGVKHEDVLPDYVAPPPPTGSLPTWVTSPNLTGHVTFQDDFPLSDTWHDQRAVFEARKRRRERLANPPQDDFLTRQKAKPETADKMYARHRRERRLLGLQESDSDRKTYQLHRERLKQDSKLLARSPAKWEHVRRLRELRGIEKERAAEAKATNAFVEKFRARRSNRSWTI